jgi:hypothetical protein
MSSGSGVVVVVVDGAVVVVVVVDVVVGGEVVVGDVDVVVGTVATASGSPDVQAETSTNARTETANSLMSTEPRKPLWLRRCLRRARSPGPARLPA